MQSQNRPVFRQLSVFLGIRKYFTLFLLLHLLYSLTCSRLCTPFGKYTNKHIFLFLCHEVLCQQFHGKNIYPNFSLYMNFTFKKTRMSNAKNFSFVEVTKRIVVVHFQMVVNIYIFYFYLLILQYFFSDFSKCFS